MFPNKQCLLGGLQLKIDNSEKADRKSAVGTLEGQAEHNIWKHLTSDLLYLPVHTYTPRNAAN